MPDRIGHRSEQAERFIEHPCHDASYGGRRTTKAPQTRGFSKVPLRGFEQRCGVVRQRLYTAASRAVAPNREGRWGCWEPLKTVVFLSPCPYHVPMSPSIPTCENCGRPATIIRITDHGDAPTCDACVPGDWTGEAKPLPSDARADLSGRKALSKAEAADSLGVSVDHFEQHVMPDLRVISRGRRVLIPAAELDRWVADSAARALKGR